MAQTRRTYDELFEIVWMMEDYYPDQFRQIIEMIAVIPNPHMEDDE